jgi:hypothetical protein
MRILILLQAALVSVFILMAFPSAGAAYLHADANGDFVVDISDVVFVLSYVFSGGAAPSPLAAGDLNCDSAVDIGDAVYLIAFIFSGGPAPCATSPSSGELAGVGDCKPAGGGKGDEPECLEFSYDGRAILDIKHLNAAFNCCATISSFVTVHGQYIDIYVDEEFESAPCPCICLKDLNYRVLNLPPGQYQIRVEQLYVPTGDSSVNCDVNLSGPTSGNHCVARSIYPWVE